MQDIRTLSGIACQLCRVCLWKATQMSGQTLHASTAMQWLLQLVCVGANMSACLLSKCSGDFSQRQRAYCVYAGYKRIHVYIHV